MFQKEKKFNENETVSRESKKRLLEKNRSMEITILEKFNMDLAMGMETLLATRALFKI